jgi:hypothetical protein
MVARRMALMRRPQTSGGAWKKARTAKAADPAMLPTMSRL